ncbi:MAG: hypothetical protein WCO85_07775, partial [Actinomycetes bacterium]
LVSSNVFASLNATAFNTTAQNIAVGTLKLTQANNGIGGITTNIGLIQPGDTQNRYVAITNGGSLAGSAMTLQIADSQTAATISTATASAGTATFTTTAAHNFVAGQTVTISGVTVATSYNNTNVTIAATPSSTTFTVVDATMTGSGTGGTATPLSTLTSDATNGLKITAYSCSVAWVATTGVCSGTISPLFSPSISITAIAASAGTVTYTAANSLAAGNVVTITGATVAAYNLQNAVVASASGTQFTVTSAATGATSTAIAVKAVAASALVSAAQTLVPGSLVLTAGGTTNVQLSMYLPSTLAETTINGALPATTLQGAVGSIKWTFTEAQVAGTTTNS